MKPSSNLVYGGIEGEGYPNINRNFTQESRRSAIKWINKNLSNLTPINNKRQYIRYTPPSFYLLIIFRNSIETNKDQLSNKIIKANDEDSKE